MSPGISMSVSVAPFALQVHGKPPRFKVLAALALARACGIQLRQSADCGVERDLNSGRWGAVMDRRAGGVNILGSLLLALQPVTSPDEDVSAAGARAVGVPLAWMEGAVDGWNHETQSSYWLQADIGRKQYLDGYVAGCECLAFNTLVCDRCGSRRFRSERACPGCGR